MLYGKTHLIYTFISLISIIFVTYYINTTENISTLFSIFAYCLYFLFLILFVNSGCKTFEERDAFKQLSIEEKYYYYVRNNKYKKIKGIINNKDFIFPKNTFHIEKKVAKNNIKFLNIILKSADFDPTLNDNIIFEKSTPQIRKILWEIPKVKKTLKLTRPKIYQEIISDKINLF